MAEMEGVLIMEIRELQNMVQEIRSALIKPA